MIRRKIKTFVEIARRSPAAAWELAQIRAERATGIPLFFVSASRSLTYAFEVLNTSKVTPDLALYGNYYLSPTHVPANPIVFSLGIGQNTSFDEAVLEKHTDAQLFMFDPTPTSRRFVDGLRLPKNAKFFGIAIGDTDGDVPVYSDDLSNDPEETTSVSMLRRGNVKPCATVTCRRITTFMKENNLTSVDVLKMDIEGAAIDVLESTLDAGIFPAQIACEFERPANLRDVVPYLRRDNRQLARLRESGYSVYRTRDTDKGCQIEILALRRQTAST